MCPSVVNAYCAFFADRLGGDVGDGDDDVIMGGSEAGIYDQAGHERVHQRTFGLGEESVQRHGLAGGVGSHDQVFPRHGGMFPAARGHGFMEGQIRSLVAGGAGRAEIAAG